MSFDFNRYKKGEVYDKANRGFILEPIFQKGISIHDIYEVYDENKSGGIGFIGLCKNKKDKKFYVLKTYQREEYRDILHKEIEFALRLEKHPHIVYSQTALKEKGRVYLVMELVGKQPKNGKEDWKAATLTQELQKGISIEESYKWAIEFCRGMQYLNSIGLKSHQDITPNNIFITEERHVKVADFGFVTLKEEQGQTKCGTPYYYSPEHYIEDKELDIRSDIYSFGIVLYEIFNAGTNLYPKTRIGKLRRKNKFIEISKIKSKHCNEIIKKCLQPKQEERYQTFKELEEDLLKEAKKEIGKEFEVKKLPIGQMEVKDYYYKGNGYNNIEYYKKAIKYFDKVIKLSPKKSYFYKTKCITEEDLKQYEELVEKYDRTILVYVYNVRGNAKYYLKQYKNAIKDYNEAIKLNSKYAYAYSNRGNVKKELKQNEEAITDYNRAIELDPNFSAAYNNRGIAKQNLRQYEEAIKDYNKAIEINPIFSEAYYNRGNAKKELKQYEESIKDYDKAIELDSKNVYAYNNRGNAKKILKQNEEAIKDYYKVIEFNPNNSGIYNKIGLIKVDLNQYEEAIKYFTEAIKLDSQNISAYNNRGNVKLYLKQYENAIRDYDMAINLDSKDATAYNNRGTAKYNLKKYKEAIRDYDVAIKLSPQYFTAYNNRGAAKANLKQYEEAIKDYNIAIKINAQFIYAYYNRGNANKDLKQYEAAINDYIKAIEIDKKYISSYKNLIEIYKLLGKEKEAEEIEEQLKQITKK